MLGSPRTSILACLVALALPALAQDVAEDEGAARAERDRRRDDHFALCDLDENGWISFREAAAVLGIDRADFLRLDTNGDGGIDAEEFSASYNRILAYLGAVPEPIPGPTPPPLAEEARGTERDARAPSPETLLMAADRDGSGGLSKAEVGTVLRRLKADLSADLIVDRADRDGTGELEPDELAPLGRLVAERMPARPGPAAETPADERRDEASHALPPAPPAPRTTERPDPTPRITPPPDEVQVDETRTPDPVGLPDRTPATTPDSRPGPLPGLRPLLPPRGPAPSAPVARPVAAPRTHFERLDRDGDGFVDADDLRALVAPARVDVRPATVLAALDQDGDGRLDAAEFQASMRRPRGATTP